MYPVNQGPPQQPQPPAPATPSLLSRLGARLGGFVMPLLASRDTTSLEGKTIQVMNSSCGKLIRDISDTMTRVILQKADSTFVSGGEDEIHSAMQDLTQHIFTVFATEGIDDEAIKQFTGDELADHFLGSILKTVITEFEQNPQIDAHQHFINIAEKLLHAAFPDGVEDTKIPIVLRKLLGGNSLLMWVAQKKLGTEEDLSWNGVTDLFAKHLEGIYKSLEGTAGKAPDEQSAPGANQFIKTIVDKIDSATTQTSTIPLSIPLLNAESNTFVTSFLKRLLQGQFTRQEDKELLDKARSWLLGHMQTSLQAVFSTIFTCRQGQSPEERRIEFADHITFQASKILPQTKQQFAEIDQMNIDSLKARLLEWKSDPERRYHHTQIDNALHLLAENNEHAAEVKALMKSITAFISLQQILKKEFNSEKLQPLLPSFLSADTIFEQIYSFASPYLVEIIAQFDETDRQGGLALQELSLHGGQEITGWIDGALKMAHSLLEAKAEALTIQPTEFAFINDLLCYALKPAAIPSGTEIKPYIDKQLKNIISIIIEKAVAAKQGQNNPEKAIAEILDAILESGQEATLALIQAKKDPQETKIARTRSLAQELGITLKVDALNDANLEATFESLFMTKASRSILIHVLPKELFNQLLPPFLRSSHLWEGVAELISNYLKGVSLQAGKIQDLTGDVDLTLKVPELKEMLTTLSAKLLTKLKARPEAAPETSFDKIKSHVLQGKGLLKLVENALPKIVEAFIAFHVNPKDGLTSQARTANLFMQFISLAQRGFDKVEDYEKAADKASWLIEHGYNEEAFVAYRKKHDMKVDAPINMSNFLLQETTETLVSALFPKRLLDRLIPKEFAIFKVDQLLANLCSEYIEDAYNYSQAIKQLATEQGEPTLELLVDVQKYLELQIQDYFASDAATEKTWVEEVTRQIFTAPNSAQKATLLKFTANIYFGAIGYIFKSAQSLPNAAGDDTPNNLLKMFEPIAQNAQNIFYILNTNTNNTLQTKLQKLKITNTEIRAYLHAIKKPVDKIDFENLNLHHLAYWAAARKALDVLFSDEAWSKRIPSFLHNILTKDAAATFATTAYETIHTTQNVLQKKEDQGLILVRSHPSLEAFAEEYFVANIKELLQELGQSPHALSPTLPVLLDALLKACCKDESTKVGEIRDTAIRRLLYTIMGKLLSDQKSIIQKASELLASYKGGDTLATASMLLEATLPQEVREAPLASLVISKVATKELADCIAQIKQSEVRILKEGKDAKEYLYSLDGMKPFVQDIMQGLDESLDRMALDKDMKLSDTFPGYIDTLLKQAILTPALKPTIKKALHNAVYIILQEVLTPRLGQSIQNRVLEVSSQLISLYNAPNSQQTGTAWLKLLLPENRLQGLLPEFMQNIVTHEKLIKWFFKPYVEQVEAVQKNITQENSKPISSNISRAQGYVQKLLLNYTKPSATKLGLFGFEGVVRELERTLLGTLADNTHADITPVMQSYLKATVSQITRTVETKGMLEPEFLSEALIGALPHLETIPNGMPQLADFAPRATEALLAMIFPGGKKDLPIPDIAKDFVWRKVNLGIQDFFLEITDPHRRILWATDRLIPMTTSNEALLGRRLQDVEDMRNHLKAGNPPDTAFIKKAEAAFKRYTVAAAVRQADHKVKESNLWGPLKWIARQVVKAVTYLTVRFSLRDRIYAFVADPASDQKIRQALWSFLHFKAHAQKRPEKERQEALSRQLKATLAKQSLAPAAMQGIISSQMAHYLANKNVLDVLA